MTPGARWFTVELSRAVGCPIGGTDIRHPGGLEKEEGMRRLISFIAALSAVILATNVVVARAPDEVRTTGDERVVPNAMVQATLRFTPGLIRVASGDSLTWTHDDATTAPHTATIVAAFPEPTLEAIFGCGAPDQPCGQALAAHAASGPVVDVGDPGFNEPGDSLFFVDDTSISAPVTAPAGTTLKYLCAIHPWMQGEIVVD
jgi:plastocyanin